MAPKYKLTYFDFTGLGESIRFLFSYGGIEFIDNRVSRADWVALKPTIPLQQMPLLEFDGKVLHQSVAISRYVGRLVGLAGKNDLEDYEIDAVVDTITDFRLQFLRYRFEANPETKQALKEKLDKETIPLIFGQMDSWVKKNNGYLANARLTWADVYFAALMEMITQAQADLLDNYPNLKAVVKNVLSLPKIKAWVEKRPKDVL
uniref:glutathione transferase n=1 Tax=Dendroctonus armandi TaxID=77159 RepID=A0A5P9JTU8_9CUCU|nr:glutathione S-transferase GSTs7 [Dendroctonus armandi]